MLIEKIKEEIKSSTLSKDEIKKNILKVALGEINTLQSRSPSSTDDQFIKLLEKLVNSNKETISFAQDVSVKSKLEQEITILSSFIPKKISVDDLLFILEKNSVLVENIKSAKSDGQAMGQVIKYLKNININFNNSDVTEAIKKIKSIV